MPRLYTTTEVARPAYYDRQAIPVGASMAVSVPPHAMTTRWTYTPPTGYAAFLETFFGHIERNGVAGVTAFQDIFIDVQPFYGGTIPVMSMYHYNAAANSTLDRDSNSYGYLAYGDTFRCRTLDGSTGGNGYYEAAFKGTEFLY